MQEKLGYLIVEDKRVSYNINIYSKYTIITGFSGIGKSHLLDTIARAFDLREDSEDMFSRLYKIESNFDIVILDNTIASQVVQGSYTWTRYLETMYKSGTLFCIDEDFRDLYTFEFQKAMMVSENYFLIICRNPLKFILYSVYDIYKLELSDNGAYHYNKRFYDPTEHVARDFSKFNMLCVEDSKSGLQFFKSFLDNVTTSYGNKTIPSLIEQCRNTIFCIDGLGFGSEFLHVLNLLKLNPSNSLWVIDSFEGLILNSNWFKRLGYIVDLDRSQPNLEKQTTEILREILEKNHIRYTKKKVPMCFVKDCCFDQYHHTPSHKCGLFCSGNKLELVLGKDLLDNLIKAFGDARVKDDKIPALAGAGSQQLSAKGYSSNLELEYEEIPDEASEGFKDEKDSSDELNTDLFTNVF